MNAWRGEDLSESEKKAIAALPRERAPSPALEEHVVAELRRRGVLWRKRRPALWLVGATVAASIGIVLAILNIVRDRPPATSSQAPHWVLLLREGREDRSIPEEESLRRIREYASWARSASTQGLLDGEKLADGGLLLTPEGESHAVRTPTSLSGYFLLGDVSEDSVRSLAASCPHLKYGGEIELRRIEVLP